MPPDERTPFVMVPVAYIEAAPDPACFLLYAALDSLQRFKQGQPFKASYRKLGRILRLKPETVAEHAGHLVTVGWVKLTVADRSSAIWKVENPARKLHRRSEQIRTTDSGADEVATAPQNGSTLNSRSQEEVRVWEAGEEPFV